MGLRSLEIIESGTIWKLGYGFLFAFRSNYGRICSHFGDIQHQTMASPWNLGLESSSILYHLRVFDVELYRDLEIWRRGYSRSLKMVLFKSLGVVFAVRCYAYRGYCRHPVSVCPSVCASVTFVSCAKTNKDIFEIFSPSGSDTILVSHTKGGADILTGTL